MKNYLKLYFLLLLTLSLFTQSTQAQQSAIHVTSTDHDHEPGRTCAAHTILQEQIEADPSLGERMRVMEENTQRYIRENRGNHGRSTRVIPVYVHVIYSKSQENISDAQIQSQINQLNADFAATNADYNPPADFASVASGNTGIQFRLERVTRKSSTRTAWGTSDAMKRSSSGGVDVITPSTHLNMWVCNLGNSLLGYAQFPGGASATDGVVMSPQYFGSNNFGSGYYLAAPYDKGRTTTHEVGHYLNLRHIWGDGDCSKDDGVSDTPVAGRSNSGCPSNTHNTCPGGKRDMHMNYMDYTQDACMYMFSKGQKARMLACLATSRSSLGSTSGGGNTCYARVGLKLVTDRYASETSWTVKNSSGTTVASGNGYANSTTYNLSWTLPDGNYTFTINDSQSDGICCAYGNGSYSIIGDGTTIATGGNFGRSATVNFCVRTTPACPSNVSLTLVTDKYASETSWEVRTTSGTLVKSGSGYANNSTNNINLNLNSGSYRFTIKDSYGDGICCNYGQGSFALKGDGRTLGSGSNFGRSATVNFCVGSGSRSTAKVTSTDTEETLKLDQINLYPNPANNTINVNLNGNATNFTGRILDATGRNVWVGTLENGHNAININGLPTGLYYMAVVKKDGQVLTKKFVKK